MLSSCAACMYVQLGLGTGVVNRTEWVGGGGGGLTNFGDNAIFSVMLPLPLFPESWSQKGRVYNSK